jgi:hypothetical protein
MKIDKVQPPPQPPPPPVFQLQFSRDDGWTIVAALNAWVARHPQAQGIDEVQQWAIDLDKKLRD